MVLWKNRRSILIGKRKVQKDKMDGKQMVHTSILLVLLALVSITAATVAWFSIADRTKVRSMSMEITTGVNLRFDLDAHDTFDEYVKTLGFEQIGERIEQEKGFKMSEVPLEPVTTTDYAEFTFENGTVVSPEKGAYLEFTLNFMSTQDMDVYLTTEDSSGKTDGTKIESSNPELPNAMRISFTSDNETMVYDPGNGDVDIRLFSLKKEKNQPVIVHIWIEGTDEACTDALRGADYQISMRFVGKDENGNVLDGTSESR